MAIHTILLVGAGNMGRALLKGWLEQRVTLDPVVVVEPDVGAREMLSGRVTCVASEDDIQTERFDAIVFAIKPQKMGELVSRYQRFKSPETVFVSIAAGRSLASLADQLGADAALVRAMPNTPAAIARGMTVLCANAATRPAQRDIAERLLRSVGEVAWIQDEALMDAVTALSGSGPAYVFLLIESMVNAGINAGLPADLALQLARTTVAGAGQLALTSQHSPADLRRQVTSKGGTTEAALNVLGEQSQFASLINRAVRAARDRGAELASE